MRKQMKKEVFKRAILEFLVKKGCIGGAHTPLDRVRSCTEMHSKQDKKEFEEALEDLIRNEWVFVLNKRTGRGSDEHISINPRAMKEIAAFLNM